MISIDFINRAVFDIKCSCSLNISNLDIGTTSRPYEKAKYVVCLKEVAMGLVLDP